jgi:small subunit ribosomal protein S4
MDAVVRRGVPQWLELEKDAFKGTIKGYPVREDLTMPIQEQLIVELYSK